MRTYLRRIDMKLDALAERVGNLETEMVRMRRHLALIGDETAHERAARASIENRLDRVERRSQIADGVR
jgi:uncharacterized membrane protein